MRQVEPTDRHHHISGAFKIDREALDRLIQTAHRHVSDEQRRLEVVLEFRDGRKLVSNDVEDLAHFPFHQGNKEKFSIEIENAKEEMVQYRYHFDSFGRRGSIWVRKVKDGTLALRDASEAMNSTRAWYGWLSPSVAYIAISAGIMLVPIVGYGTLTKWDFISYPIYLQMYLIALSVLIVATIARFSIRPAVAMMFGLEGQRLRTRLSVAKWVVGSIGALCIAVVGGGYFKA